MPEAQAPAALLVTEEGAKVLQSASDLPPELVANVTIDTITYTPEGAVQLAGRGTPERVVRLYLDNAPLIEAAISAAGDWAVTLPEVAPGIYTLRADQVDATGAVTSRFETPFKRETVEALAAVAEVPRQKGLRGPVRRMRQRRVRMGRMLALKRALKRARIRGQRIRRRRSHRRRFR